MFEWIRKGLKKSYYYIRPLSFVNILFYFLSGLLVLGICWFVKDTVSEGVEHSSKVLIFVALCAALITLIYNIRRHLSEDYYKEAKSQLEKAFYILQENPDKPITRDRLKWLTCARLLLSADRISKKIIMSSHKHIYKEDKQYWKARFYEIIEDFSEDFYAGYTGDFFADFVNGRNKISLASVYAVHKFMQWDDDYIDPLEIKEWSDEQLSDISRNYPILRSVIKKAKEIN